MMLSQLPLFDRLAGSKRILLAGMGGGFDIYCGIPLYIALRNQGKQVIHANLTFANTNYLKDRPLAPSLAAVHPDSDGSTTYFPERTLCRWLKQTLNIPDPVVYCIERTGAVGVREAYAALVDHYNIDAIVLIDGGTDSLMRGDESGLGTPHEDMISLAAADDSDVRTKLLVCLGFGIDSFHGVCHAHMLENVAALSQEGAFLGTFSLLPHMPEAKLYLDAIDHANTHTPKRESIVNNSIASALEGQYGNVHRTERTNGSTLWINPLMTLYWAFELEPVAKRVLYLDELRKTQTFRDVILFIEAYRKNRSRRAKEGIPV